MGGGVEYVRQQKRGLFAGQNENELPTWYNHRQLLLFVVCCVHNNFAFIYYITTTFGTLNSSSSFAIVIDRYDISTVFVVSFVGRSQFFSTSSIHHPKKNDDGQEDTNGSVWLVRTMVRMDGRNNPCSLWSASILHDGVITVAVRRTPFDDGDDDM